MKCCDVHSGLLRTPVTFERLTRSSDGQGGYSESWATVSGAPTACYYKGASGSERMMAQRLDAQVSAKITVRYYDGLLESDRAVIDGKVYQIRYIDNLEMQNRWLVIAIDGGVAT